jgi:hypothetical protein
MMKIIRIGLLITIFFLVSVPVGVFAQTYLFSVDQLTLDVYLSEDGTASIEYVIVFTDNPAASPIDYVDLGLPNANFDDNSISAEINGVPITDISRGGYEGIGEGVALGLGNNAIQPGDTGTVHVLVGTVNRVLYPDSDDGNYASAVFSPTWFGSQFVEGTTDMSVTFHLPAGIQPEEPRWHSAPKGWPSEPETGIDEQGRITYTWSNSQALGYEQYKFGASIPSAYIPAESIIQPSTSSNIGIGGGDLIFSTLCCGFIALFGLGIVGAYRGSQSRKLNYLSPKISIEGHGIKRGLTSVEAAILLEQPMDKILTMILFSTIKKVAATVVKRDPLELEIIEPPPKGLHLYEINFLEAFKKKPAARRKALQTAMIDLVNSVSKKMKGFSRKETVAYYKDITKRAWAQVEAADTPEVKSEKFDEVMEWTMLDKDYEDRTKDVFRTGPVFIPTWWPRFDPGYGRTVSSRPIPIGTTGPSSSSGGGISMPHLPGSDFAASVVNSTQNFAGSVIGNLTDFTGGVTQKTNPPPVSTSRSGSSRSGGGCACACACAGCACACAGGGR